MSKKVIKKAPAKKAKTEKVEATADRLRNRIVEYQKDKSSSMQQLQQLSERVSQLDGAIFALTEQLNAEESQ